MALAPAPFWTSTLFLVQVLAASLVPVPMLAPFSALFWGLAPAYVLVLVLVKDRRFLFPQRILYMENPRRIHHKMKGFHDHLPMPLETSQNVWCGDPTASSSFHKCGAFSDKDGVLRLLSWRRTMQSVFGRREKDYTICLWSPEKDYAIYLW
ncbi:hypothetical protein L1887_27643 [Cichorium endivia]|nr:hypothetical protein L1887_27643 [Cichorium endivia]